MKKTNLIVILAALINILLVVAAPKYFSGGSLLSEPEFTARHQMIIKSLREGLPVSMDDLHYYEKQTDSMSVKRLKRAEENFSGTSNFKIETKSIVLVSGISMSVLALLCYLGCFASAESLVYFLVSSLPVLLFAPIGSGQLLLIIIANALLVYLGVYFFGNVRNLKKLNK